MTSCSLSHNYIVMICVASQNGCHLNHIVWCIFISKTMIWRLMSSNHQKHWRKSNYPISPNVNTWRNSKGVKNQRNWTTKGNIFMNKSWKSIARSKISWSALQSYFSTVNQDSEKWDFTFLFCVEANLIQFL